MGSRIIEKSCMGKLFVDAQQPDAKAGRQQAHGRKGKGLCSKQHHIFVLLFSYSSQGGQAIEKQRYDRMGWSAISRASLVRKRGKGCVNIIPLRETTVFVIGRLGTAYQDVLRDST